MSKAWSFEIDGWFIPGGDAIYSDKSLVCGAQDKDFEKMNIVMSVKDVERLHQAILDSEEEQDDE